MPNPTQTKRPRGRPRKTEEEKAKPVSTTVWFSAQEDLDFFRNLGGNEWLRQKVKEARL